MSENQFSQNVTQFLMPKHVERYFVDGDKIEPITYEINKETQKNEITPKSLFVISTPEFEKMLQDISTDVSKDTNDGLVSVIAVHRDLSINKLVNVNKENNYLLYFNQA